MENILKGSYKIANFYFYLGLLFNFILLIILSPDTDSKKKNLTLGKTLKILLYLPKYSNFCQHTTLT